ncbi:MAG: hypothetical protein LQ341_000223 [Variospora aurantia]|nr:MAG: hypothetical protein LQ341_000223 [Variospora aurantia]
MTTPTLINLPPPPSDPATPSELGPHAHKTSNGSESSTNTLDAERADRISRLAGLEPVATGRGSNTHLTPTSVVPAHPTQAPGYFDHAGVPHGKERSTVGSASATGSVGGRTTWASGSDVHDADKMSEDQEDGASSTAGLSDEGNASLVGFGEGASSTVSGPVSTSARVAPGSRVVGAVGSPLAGKFGMRDSGSPMQGVQAEDAKMLDGMTYDDGDAHMVDTTPRHASRGHREASITAREQAEHMMADPLTRGPQGNLKCCVYSPCSRYFAWASPERVTVIDASVGHVITTIPAQNVFELGFSPLGSFIITWQRPSKDENGDAVKNLKVWSVLEGQATGPREAEHNIVGRFVQKSQTGWNLQYTYDERYCARVVTNEVQFYKSGDLGNVWNKLLVEGVLDFSVSPSENHSIAVFAPERKGQPAAVKVYNAPEFSTPVSQKKFFKGDKVQLKWNQKGTELIVLAQTEVDKTGKSYYGETTLYLLSVNGGFDSRIDLGTLRPSLSVDGDDRLTCLIDKDGPIHDVTWSPNSLEFGVVYGYMPAKTTIFDVRGQATHNFALSPRNTILFSPHGRFVLVAGFGNLAGQMDIYDLEKNYQKVCTIEASNASVCEWSPDGKYILTATTSPRLRVDNGVRIWHVGGALMYNEDLQELYHVTWRPQSQTKPPHENLLHPVPTPHTSALAYLGTVKTPSKPAGAYRPPGARGQLTPLAFKREDEGGAAYVSSGSLSLGIGVNGFGKPRKREVPGTEPVSDNGNGTTIGNSADGDDQLSKAALKNKKKREAKKAKDAAEKATGLAPTADNAPPAVTPSPGRSPERRDREGHERNRSRGFVEPRPQSKQGQRNLRRSREQQSSKLPPGPKTNGMSSAPAASEPAPDLTVTSPGSGGSPQDKKVRALLKKLRAIDDLKMRRAGGEKLEGTQIRKMDTEDEVRQELDSLGWNE